MATHTRRTRLFHALSLILLLWFVPACGSSPSAPEPTPTPTPTPQTTALTYSGTYQSSDGSYGSISVTAQIPVAILSADAGSSAPKAIVSATGTLKPGGAPSPITLTGTYDTVTGKFTMTGGSFTVTATVTAQSDGNVLNGSVTTPVSQGTVVALPPSATSTIITYCGNYTGGSGGTLVITRRDNKLVALVAENGEPAPFSINGTLNGTAVTLSFTWAPPDIGQTTAIGTLNGSVITGTWSSTFVENGKPGSEGGNWVVRAGSCPL